MAERNERGGWDITDEEAAEVLRMSEERDEQVYQLPLIAAFLEARIGEDEHRAWVKAADLHLHWCAATHVDCADPCDCGNPARALREIAAKRTILVHWPDPFGNWTAEQAEAVRAVKLRAFRALAAIWSGHPDYDRSWSPR
jgi:hypothetical protein